jgi:hypothetical protein
MIGGEREGWKVIKGCQRLTRAPRECVDAVNFLAAPKGTRSIRGLPSPMLQCKSCKTVFSFFLLFPFFSREIIE